MLLCLSCCLFAQELPGDLPEAGPDINTSWQKLELSLSELERTLLRLQNDNALLTETLSEQEKLLSDSRQASAAVLEQYRKSELALQKSERTLKCWKTACGITIGITVPTIVVLAVFLAK